MPGPTEAQFREVPVFEGAEAHRFRTLVRLREAGLSEAAIRTMLPEWTVLALSGRTPADTVLAEPCLADQSLAGLEPNTGSPR